MDSYFLSSPYYYLKWVKNKTRLVRGVRHVARNTRPQLSDLDAALPSDPMQFSRPLRPVHDSRPSNNHLVILQVLVVIMYTRWLCGGLGIRRHQACFSLGSFMCYGQVHRLGPRTTARLYCQCYMPAFFISVRDGCVTVWEYVETTGMFLPRVFHTPEAPPACSTLQYCCTGSRRREQPPPPSPSNTNKTSAHPAP